ncbi:hypothetical protein KKF84_11995 [Myxococcota bacterium]|nr:hypothetical protein [Myxococcota bacterium]MBU1536035.1 hypothetical protein [Myxococcota bacterium]
MFARIQINGSCPAFIHLYVCKECNPPAMKGQPVCLPGATYKTRGKGAPEGWEAQCDNDHGFVDSEA